MTNETTAPERLVNTQTKEAQRVQGAVLASAAHLSTQRFQGWANPVVASCKDAADLIGALLAEREAAQARIAELEVALASMYGRHEIYCGGPDFPFAGHTDKKLMEMARAALEGKG